MRWQLLSAAIACGCVPSGDADPAASTLDTASTRARFEHPSDCATCHPMQYKEWAGSAKHYAAASPVFNAFELINRAKTDGAFAPDGEHPAFCIQCHAPSGVLEGDLQSSGDDPDPPASIFELSDVSRHGVSCDFCHRTTHADRDASLLGDGIANKSVFASPGPDKQGPIRDPVPVDAHDAEHNGFLRSSEFCGGCHDVRLPQQDILRNESGIQSDGPGSGDFSRLENLFTEYERSGWASGDNPVGKPVSCQDCHMSLYPMQPPGTYPEVPVAAGPDRPVRRHAIHAFTAVSAALTPRNEDGSSTPFPDRLPDLVLPNIDVEAVDDFGFPLGQEQRRRQMLAAACTLDVSLDPSSVTSTATVLPVDVIVENIGAGHRVPAGFSQEREVWIELTVRDDVGVIYRSGYLEDRPHPSTGESVPDGRLHDEELNHGHYVVDEDLGFEVLKPGPDVDQRPQVQLGLVNFQNGFMHITRDGDWLETSDPLAANHFDNTRSLPPLDPQTYRYDVPLTRPLSGTVDVSATLRYRAFPPHFLRSLAVERPDLVDEAMVDRNTIVDMASDRVERVVTP